MKWQAKRAIAAFGGAAALTVLVGCGAGLPASGAPAAPTLPTSTSAAPPPPTSPQRAPDSGCISGANC